MTWRFFFLKLSQNLKFCKEISIFPPYLIQILAQSFLEHPEYNLFKFSPATDGMKIRKKESHSKMVFGSLSVLKHQSTIETNLKLKQIVNV